MENIIQKYIRCYTCPYIQLHSPLLHGMWKNIKENLRKQPLEQRIVKLDTFMAAFSIKQFFARQNNCVAINHAEFYKSLFFNK